MLEYGWFAERWQWSPQVVDEQPLQFIRYAPAVFGAIDKMRQDEQEREQRKARTSDAAHAQQRSPRYGGR